VAIPRPDSTQIAGIAHAAAGTGPPYGPFQAASALLLLAAASSSFRVSARWRRAWWLAGTTGW